MSTSTITARSLLSEQAPEGAGTGLAAALADAPAVRSGMRGVRKLSTAGLRAVNAEVGGVADELLEIDLGDALVLGWRKYAALQEAARRTLADPGGEEIVLLASHTVRSQHQPSVDLVVDGLTVNRFEFDVVIELVVTGVAAVVREGALVALRSGRCDVSVSVALEGARLLEAHRTLDAALLLPLPRPVALAETSPVTMPRQLDRTEATAPGVSLRP